MSQVESLNFNTDHDFIGTPHVGMFRAMSLYVYVESTAERIHAASYISNYLNLGAFEQDVRKIPLPFHLLFTFTTYHSTPCATMFVDLFNPFFVVVANNLHQIIDGRFHPECGHFYAMATRQQDCFRPTCIFSARHDRRTCYRSTIIYRFEFSPHYRMQVLRMCSLNVTSNSQPNQNQPCALRPMQDQRQRGHVFIAR